jgi:hypothetical protein
LEVNEFTHYQQENRYGRPAEQPSMFIDALTTRLFSNAGSIFAAIARSHKRGHENDLASNAANITFGSPSASIDLI